MYLSFAFMKSLLLILCITGLLATQLKAQHDHNTELRCQFYQNTSELPSYFINHQEVLQERIKARQVNFRTEEQVYRIPVIVHVMHYGEPIGTGTNISAAQIQSQIEVLNEDFRRLNPDRTETVAQFTGVAGDSGIEFYLAQLDSSGNRLPERGIIRRLIERRPFWTNETFDAEIKPSTIWDPSRYLNIWVIDSLRLNNQTGIGYAQFPDLSGLDGLQPQGGLALTDGIVIRYNRIGSFNKVEVPQLARGPYNLGRTLTHEMGHFFGLLHTFDALNCTDSDFCPDTPPTDSPNFRCNLTRQSCGTLTMIQNYMDFTDDFCMNLFTRDQIRRMRTVLDVSPRRRELAGSVVGFNDAQLQQQVKIYPNPASEGFRIHFEAGQLRRCSLISLTGQVLSQEDASGNEHFLQTGNIGAGIYLLQAETDAGLVVKKVSVLR
jgi:hypothetical protein